MNLSELNEKQKEAVTAPMGPVLVLAGAGSGKTKVLTYRIAYLIEQKIVKPENILAVTFTNKASKEMQTRIGQLLGNGTEPTTKQVAVNQPTLGTFHSIGARLLRQQISRLGYSPQFTILDTDDALKVIKDICKDLDIPKNYNPTLFRAYISTAKNLLQTPAELSVGLEGYLHELVQQVYIRYQDFIFKQNSVDFDDLLMLPIKLFEAFPAVLRKYQELWQYILVDEYQDTNQAQYMFLHLLAKNRNLFVVGDDAQSIYGFRGSDITNILNFEHDFKDALVIKLEQNYRSTKNILASAQKVIELNIDQKPKTLWTTNADGEKVVVRELTDGRGEAEFVASTIIKLATGQEVETELEYENEIDDGVGENSVQFSILDQYLASHRRQRGRWSGGGKFGSGFHGNSWSNLSKLQLPAEHTPLTQFAVLYRTHAQSRQVEEVLIEAGIPYQIIGGVKFFERKEIKDALAYLRLILNPKDLISLARVVNVPARGFGDKSFNILKDYILARPTEETADAFLGSLSMIPVPSKQHQSLILFYENIKVLMALRSDATVSELLKVMLKLTKLEDYYKDGTDAGDARIENLRELGSVTAKFDNMPWQEGLVEFLEEVALITELDNLGNKKDCVTLMTLHSAKGLEFDTVFFIGLEEGLLPHSQALLEPTELAEEIRLAYVGLTRARHQLFLLYAQSRQMYGNYQVNPPSRILKALPSEAIKFHGNLANLYSDTDLDNHRYEPFE